jgi:hypothetical protein
MDMSRIEISLTRLEARLRAAIEGDTALDGIPRKLHHQLVHGLVKAMQAGLSRTQAENSVYAGSAYAPDQYTLVLPTDQAQLLLSHPSELDHLARQLEQAATQSGLKFTASPILRVVADPNAATLQITTAHSHPNQGESSTTELDGTHDFLAEPASGMAIKAFLIVNGLSTFLLTLPVINIGSAPGNHLVLEQPGISRLHAQLRFNTDHFVIFDLDSAAGTYVNGMVVSSHTLDPGDVILLAGVPLVYGQELTPPMGYTQELPAVPPSPEVL